MKKIIGAFILSALSASVLAETVKVESVENSYIVIRAPGGQRAAVQLVGVRPSQGALGQRLQPGRAVDLAAFAKVGQRGSMPLLVGIVGVGGVSALDADLGESLLRAGQGQYMGIDAQSFLPAQWQSRYRAAQEDAQRNGRGIWKSDSGVYKESDPEWWKKPHQGYTDYKAIKKHVDQEKRLCRQDPQYCWE